MASDGKVALCFLAGVGVIALLYMAQQQTSEELYVPDNQSERQVMGLGVQGDMSLNSGTPLDMRTDVHFWAPGHDPANVNQPVVDSKHRYPAVPGGNISTVMHNGWSGVMKTAPAGNDWFLNPPEAAVV